MPRDLIPILPEGSQQTDCNTIAVESRVAPAPDLTWCEQTATVSSESMMQELENKNAECNIVSIIFGTVLSFLHFCALKSCDQPTPKRFIRHPSFEVLNLNKDCDCIRS